MDVCSLHRKASWVEPQKSQRPALPRSGQGLRLSLSLMKYWPK